MSRSSGSDLTGSELVNYWESKYPGCPPIGYLLRQKFADHWFRIHTLPGSKRYAESDKEKIEILRRHNTMLTSLLGDGKKYVLITTGYSDSAEPVRPCQQMETTKGSGKHLFTIPMHDLEGDSDPNYWHFFFSEMTWKGQSMDELLNLVADDVVSNVLFLSVDRHRLYHPYDGGGDIFVNSESHRKRIKQRHGAWLSSHPGRL